MEPRLDETHDAPDTGDPNELNETELEQVVGGLDWGWWPGTSDSGPAPPC